MESKAKLLGHAIHPMLIVFPLGLLITSVVFDVIHLVTSEPTFATVSYWMIAAGVIGGVLAAIFGLVDWLNIPAVKAIKTEPALLVRAFTDKRTFDMVLRQFRAQVEPLVRNGVEVVIPAGGLPSLLFSRIKSFRVGRAVVLDCIAVLAKTAELAVALQRFNGTRTSRLATFQKPSAKALKEFLEH